MAGTDKNRLEELAHKWLNGKLNKKEQQEFDAWFNQVRDEPQTVTSVSNSDEEFEAALFNRIQQTAGIQPGRKVRSLWPRIAAAASILLILSAGGYYLLHKNRPQQQTAQNQKTDIAPGTNQATLTLSKGEKIVLTAKLNGKLAQQGNTVIQASAGREITYETNNSATAPDAAITYNTLTTARGEESPVPLVLADGTRVWLNAASSITFPTAFTGKKRNVKISGEAYFEVKHNAAKSFTVEVKGQIIEDIGTAFDIDAYDDEPVIKTTLLSGSVQIDKDGKSALLKPGQAAITSNSSISIKNVDTEGAVAWKNGYFLFDHESLESIMRKISRWYNVDVTYASGQPVTDSFLGSITRYGNVSQVLHMLEITGHVKFTVHGRNITASKK